MNAVMRLQRTAHLEVRCIGRSVNCVCTGCAQILSCGLLNLSIHVRARVCAFTYCSFRSSLTDPHTCMSLSLYTVPAACNAGCAAVFLPYWADCKHLLPRSTSATLQTTVMACEKTHKSSSGADALAHIMSAQCAGDAQATDCIPRCSEKLRGDLLLLNVNGNDNKYSCELAHGLYSYVGPAGDGGYLGEDIRTFFSAVSVAAAGFYIVNMTRDAGIDTGLIIHSGQIVHITGHGGESSLISVKQSKQSHHSKTNKPEQTITSMSAGTCRCTFYCI